MTSDALFTPTMRLNQPDGDVAYSHTGSGDPVLIGSSMSAAAAVIVAARRPELVRALVLTGHRPEDFEARRTAVRTSLRRPEYASAFSQTTRTSHREAEALLPQVTAPSLVVMGALDPDFRDPEDEARWCADSLGGEYVMVQEAGHYPHAQQPAATLTAILAFLGGLSDA